MFVWFTILLLLVIYLILIKNKNDNNKSKEGFQNLTVDFRYSDILTAMDSAIEIFLEITETKKPKNIKVNILREEIIKGFKTSSVGKVKQFCAFPEGLYKYFYLYLFYNEYKKSDNEDITKYIENLEKNSLKIEKIVMNRINKTQKKMKQLPEKEYKSLIFYPNYLGKEKVKKDIEKSKEIFLDNLFQELQNSNENPKGLILFKKQNISVYKDNNIYKYLWTQKIALHNGKHDSPKEWKDIKEQYCKTVSKHPEDIFTYELLIELIKKEDAIFCQSVKIQNLCMLSLRPCFKELKELDLESRKYEIEPEIKKDVLSKKEQQEIHHKKLRQLLELNNKSGNAGNCFDKDNNIVYNISKRDECPSDYNWSIPCTKNRDCAYYKKNTNYKNDFGKCVNNYCQIPLGVEPRGYNTKASILRKDNIDKAFCYNCPEANPRCCATQKEPDYAFKNDYQERLKNRKDLKMKGLQVKNDSFNLEDILKYTHFN